MTLRAAFLTSLPTPARPPGAASGIRGSFFGRIARFLPVLALLGACLAVAIPERAPEQREVARRYAEPVRFDFADFEVDEEVFELRKPRGPGRAGEPVSIAPLPLKLLLHLLHQYPAAPSKDELMEALWPGTVVSEASLSQAVRAVRVALGEGARGDGIVQTVRGRGFKIGVPVRIDGRADEPAETISRGPLLGREAELERGRAALDRALQGQPRFLVLLGAPGIGKTRLGEELAAEARRQGALVLMGRGLESDQEPAFWPWVQILRSYSATVESGALGSRLGSGAPDVAAMVPEIAERLPEVEPRSGMEPEQGRFAFFDAVTAFLARAAHERPIVLVLDDLHQADEASLLLLEFLAQELPPTRLLVVATCRDEAQAPILQRALAAISRGSHGSESLTLQGLDRDAIDQLVADCGGEPPSDELLEAVYDRSEGNPLFAREVAQWVASGGGSASAADIPVGVQQVIRHRLGELPAETRSTLAAASVIGREFGIAALASVCEISPGAALESVESAERIGIVEPTSGGSSSLRFAHGLVRETLMADLSTRERADLHLRVARALESLHAAEPERVLPELAAHFAAALPIGDPAAAFDYALRAAEMDLRLLAFEQATRHAELALRIVDESGALPATSRNRVLRLLAGAQFHAGQREAAAITWWSLVESARRTDDAEALADAAMSLALSNVFTAHSHLETVGLLREALDRLGDEDSARRARLLSWLARQVTWTEESDRQDELTRSAVEMARRIGDPETLLDVLGARGSILELGGSDDDRRETYGELLALAQQGSSRAFEADALTLRLQHRIELADASGIDRDLVVLERLGDELHHPFYIAYAARSAAMRALWRGDPTQAEPLVLNAAGLGRKVDAEHAGVAFSAQLMALRRLQGRAGELEAGVREGADRYPMMASFRCALAAIQLEIGAEAQARVSFERLAADGFDEIRPDRPNYALNLALLGEVCAGLGDAERAPALEAKLEPYAGRYLTAPNIVAVGCGSRLLAALAATRGETERAEELFEQALQVERRMGATAWLVATLVERARARAATGDRIAALADLGEAVSNADPLGLVGLTRAAEALRSDLEPARKKRTRG